MDKKLKFIEYYKSAFIYEDEEGNTYCAHGSDIYRSNARAEMTLAELEYEFEEVDFYTKK